MEIEYTSEHIRVHGEPWERARIRREECGDSRIKSAGYVSLIPLLFAGR